MELPAFDPIDFKKFTDGKTIVKVRKQAIITARANKLLTWDVFIFTGHRHGRISEGWSQASHIKRHWKSLGRPGCRHQGKKKQKSPHFFPIDLLKLFRLGCMQNRQRTNGQTVWTLVPLRDGWGILFRSDKTGELEPVPVLFGQTCHSSLQVLSWAAVTLTAGASCLWSKSCRVINAFL